MNSGPWIHDFMCLALVSNITINKGMESFIKFVNIHRDHCGLVGPRSSRDLKDSVGAITIIIIITQRETFLIPPPFFSSLRMYLAQYLKQFMLTH